VPDEVVDRSQKKRLPIELKSLARDQTHLALKVLIGVATNGESEAAKVTAALGILDRGWGRPSQPHDAKVEGEIKITVRNITEGKK
jgi:hypothetical protein